MNQIFDVSHNNLAGSVAGKQLSDMLPNPSHLYGNTFLGEVLFEIFSSHQENMKKEGKSKDELVRETVETENLRSYLTKYQEDTNTMWPKDSTNGKLSYTKMIYEWNRRHYNATAAGTSGKVEPEVEATEEPCEAKNLPEIELEDVSSPTKQNSTRTGIVEDASETKVNKSGRGCCSKLFGFNKDVAQMSASGFYEKKNMQNKRLSYCFPTGSLSCTRKVDDRAGKKLGLGVSIYFKQMKSLIWLFIILSIISIPSYVLYYYAGSTEIKDSKTFFSTMTLGNIGQIEHTCSQALYTDKLDLYCPFG